MIVAITRLQSFSELSAGAANVVLVSGEPTKNSSSASARITRPINEVAISWINAPRPIPRSWMMAKTVVTEIAMALLHAADFRINVMADVMLGVVNVGGVVLVVDDGRTGLHGFFHVEDGGQDFVFHLNSFDGRFRDFD